MMRELHGCEGFKPEIYALIFASSISNSRAAIACAFLKFRSSSNLFFLQLVLLVLLNKPGTRGNYKWKIDA